MASAFIFRRGMGESYHPYSSKRCKANSGYCRKDQQTGPLSDAATSIGVVRTLHKRWERNCTWDSGAAAKETGKLALLFSESVLGH
mmetsp:Transcript_26934/g.40765  ORF Transcript_26934/g.40765 Transcript_26934/m.40765 type:complete len:86 (+) Transcript_26934:30-287(+)